MNIWGRKYEEIYEVFDEVVDKVLNETFNGFFDGYSISPKIRQILLHWDYEFAENDLFFVHIKIAIIVLIDKNYCKKQIIGIIIVVKKKLLNIILLIEKF